MTFIADRLQEAVDKAQKNVIEQATEPGVVYRIAYLKGLSDAKHLVIRAEAELEKRIWQAWKNEGVEPK